MSQKNTRLVYSCDGSHENVCKKCQQDPCVCQKSVTIVPNQTALKMRIEKKGRGGKVVTVVYDLPHNEKYFKDLTKKLKSHCGTGGSFKSNTIEIQGDQREKVKIFLLKMGFKI